MKRWILFVAAFLGLTSVAIAAGSMPLTSIRQVHFLSNEQAGKGLPVTFEATVTYYRDVDVDLFVEDEGYAIYVQVKPGAKLEPGDRVLVQGTTRGSFRPDIVGENVTLLRHGALPDPISASFQQLVRSELDCERVSVRGLVRASDMVWNAPGHGIFLQLLVDGGTVDVAIDSDDASMLKPLLDAEVEIVGVAGAKYDQKMQQTGSQIYVPRLSDIKILKPASGAAEFLPITPMEDILGSFQMQDLSRRVRVMGTITYYQPGSGVVLQNGSKSLWISTMSIQPLVVGDAAVVSGFPDVRSGYLMMDHGQIVDTGKADLIPPLPVDWNGLGYGGNAFNLISINARLLMQVRESSKDEYLLVADGHPFSAIYRHPGKISGLLPPAMKEIPVGSVVHVTGISMFYSSDPFNGPVASDVLLRSYDDIAVVARPNWLNIRHLVMVVGVLLLGIFAVSLRGWALERRLHRQAAALAARIAADSTMEKLRSSILEEINGTQPLSEIIEHITAMVSFRLDGASCWCEIADGARLGSTPSASANLRIVRQDIQARIGPPLGILLAGVNPMSPVGDDETVALDAGARLATLAIETRRVYSDLRHRSEFDQLTDIHNRFSLDQLLDEHIEAARKNASIFGLIYIDLDEFKQVNDLYGHQIGDLYLKEVVWRMKHQLRSADFLARIGGDEFAALTPIIHSRADVEEIALRLERCFDEPFLLGNLALCGTVSIGIALYPEDGTSIDKVFSAADSAMYACKNSKRNQ